MDVFSTLLQQLVTDRPGARGAVFVDWEGESVGQAGEDSEAIRLMGAHWGVVYALLQRSLKTRQLAPATSLVIGFKDRQVVVKAVDDQYLLVCDTTREISPAQALSVCGGTAALLREEM